MTVAHTCQMLGSACGYPATHNDKTLIMFDELVSNVNDKNSEVLEVTYNGVWFMVDNVYMSWSCTVPSLKDGASYKVIRFS